MDDVLCKESRDTTRCCLSRENKDSDSSSSLCEATGSRCTTVRETLKPFEATKKFLKKSSKLVQGDTAEAAVCGEVVYKRWLMMCLRSV